MSKHILNPSLNPNQLQNVNLTLALTFLAGAYLFRYEAARPLASGVDLDVRFPVLRDRPALGT